jgi:hypothetical protein
MHGSPEDGHHRHHRHHPQSSQAGYPQTYPPSPPSNGTNVLLIVLAVIGVLAVLGVLGVAGLFVLASDAKTHINESVQIGDGHARSWRLQKGTYHAHITSTGDGVDVKWIGGSCPDRENQATYDADCVLTSTGQIEVDNSHLFGGGDANVTIEVY